MRGPSDVEVDIIIPVHNSEKTLRETLDSALGQLKSESDSAWKITVYICCHDDASTDQSLGILQEYQTKYKEIRSDRAIETHFLVSKSPDGVSRGAGYARNRAVDLRAGSTSEWCFLCMLDSDDVMHPMRVAEQVAFMMGLPSCVEQDRALLGTQFSRDPPDATWHYASWANNLTDERLYLERFREVTLIQPTWMISRRRFLKFGGYIEAVHPHRNYNESELVRSDDSSSTLLRLVHPSVDNQRTLRLAEDLRFFHAHLHDGGTLHLLRRELVVYKQVSSCDVPFSQSTQTPRKLLLGLRIMAFEECILRKCSAWQHKFIVWGAGRDGKDFVKGLANDLRHRVYCFVDVDEKKIEHGYYANKDIGVKIPIVHFSYLIKDDHRRRCTQKLYVEGSEADDPGFGKISKAKPNEDDTNRNRVLSAPSVAKRQRQRRLHALPGGELDINLLTDLPVAVCVALYRTNGALERNVSMIDRVEGENLWHLI